MYEFDVEFSTLIGCCISSSEMQQLSNQFMERTIQFVHIPPPLPPIELE